MMTMRRTLLALALVLLSASALVSALAPQTISATRSSPRSDVSVANPDVLLYLQLSAAPAVPTVFRAVCRVNNNGVPLSTFVASTGVVLTTSAGVVVPAAADVTVSSGTTATLTFRPSTSAAESPLCVFSFVSGDIAFTDAIATVLVEVNPPVLGLAGFDTTDGLKLDIGYTPTLTLFTAVSVTMDTAMFVKCYDPNSAAVWFSGSVIVARTSNSAQINFQNGAVAAVSDQTCSVTYSAGDVRLQDSFITVSFDFVEPRVTRNYFGKFGWCDELLHTVSGEQYTVTLTSTSVIGVDTSVIATCTPTSSTPSASLSSVVPLVFSGSFFSGSTTADLVLNVPYLVNTPSVFYTCTFAVTTGSGDGRITTPVLNVQPLDIQVELGDIRSVKPVLNEGTVVPSTGNSIVVVHAQQSQLFTVMMSHPIKVPGLTLKTTCTLAGGASAGLLTLAQFHEDTVQSTFAFTGRVAGIHTCTIAFESTAPGGGLDKNYDDIRFAEASYTFELTVVATTLSFATDKAVYQPSNIGWLSLTASEVFNQDTDVTISCPGAGVLASSFFRFRRNNATLTQRIRFTASALPGVHACTLVVLASAVQGDVRYAGVTITGNLWIEINAPRLTFEYCDFESLKAGQTQYFSLVASEAPTADVKVEMRCVFTPPPQPAVVFDAVSQAYVAPPPPLYSLVSNPTPLQQTAYFTIKANTTRNVFAPEYRTGIKVPNGFFGNASCSAVIVLALDQRFNSSLFYNGPSQLLPVPKTWFVSLPKYEVAGTIADLALVPAGTEQTITLYVNSLTSNQRFVVNAGGLINTTMQCEHSLPPSDPSYGNLIEQFNPTKNGVRLFELTAGLSQTSVTITLPSLLASAAPVEIACNFRPAGPDFPFPTAPLATGLVPANLNKEYTFDWNNVVGSKDAAVEPFRFFIVPPTLVLSSAATATRVTSGSNIVLRVDIQDGVVAEAAVTVPVVCHVVQNGYDQLSAVPVVIAAGQNSGSATFRVRNLGAYYCSIEGALRTGDNTALLPASRLQFAGPAVALDGTVARITFFSVAATLTLSQGITQGAQVASRVQTTVTLTSSIMTDASRDVTVRLICAGEEIVFYFAAGGVSVATQAWIPFLSSASSATCVFKSGANGLPAGVDSADQSFIDIKLNPVTFSVFTPGVTFTGLQSGEELLGGEKRTLNLRVNRTVVGSGPLVARLSCAATTNFVAADFTFSLPVGSVQANALYQFVAPTLPVSNILCSFVYISGDFRFKTVIGQLTPLSISVTAVTAAVTRTQPTGPVLTNSSVTLQLQLSDNVRASASGNLVYSVQCSPFVGLAGVVKQFSVAPGAAVSTLVYPTPKLPGIITCVFLYVSGDVRFAAAPVPSTLGLQVVTPESLIVPSSSSSSSSTGAGTPGDNVNGGSSSSSSANGGGSFVVLDGESSGGLSGGAKAAVALGVILGVGLLGGLIYGVATTILASTAATAAAAGGAGVAAVGGAAGAAAGGAASAASAAAAVAPVSVVVL